MRPGTHHFELLHWIYLKAEYGACILSPASPPVTMLRWHFPESLYQSLLWTQSNQLYMHISRWWFWNPRKGLWASWNIKILQVILPLSSVGVFRPWRPSSFSPPQHSSYFSLPSIREMTDTPHSLKGVFLVSPTGAKNLKENIYLFTM